MKSLALIAALVWFPTAWGAEVVPDVPFVPTPQVVVDEMLRAAGVRADDFVMDLGSGDGRIAITAAKKFGARAVGIELDEHLIIQSEESARQAGVEDRVKFLQQDLFKTDLTPATVITMYLLPSVNRRLRPQLLDLKPGTRIVAHDFDLDDWKPDRMTTIRKNVFLWIVPAKVAGRWRARVALPDGSHTIEVELNQRYQEVNGLARIDGHVTQLWEARLRGDRLNFVLVDSADREHEASLYFEGRVAGNAIEGEIRRGVGATATRIAWQAAKVR
ncbi:MAG TPA: class I SAM-dependent methyltransferase [Burkholderiales bacterium]|nr:class I SAM-dependent methyltransferase [Burkholderiales bacterium]